MAHRNQSAVSGYRIPWVRGIVAGVAAFVAGFLLVRQFVWMDEPAVPFAFAVEDYRITAWTLFNAHAIPLTGSAEVFGSETIRGGGSNLLSLLGESGKEFLYFLPPVLLTATGALVTASLDRSRRLAHAALNGAFVVVGYLPVMGGAAYVTTVTVSGFGVDGRFGASYVDVLLFGTAYPLAFGALGGVLYHLVRQS